MNKKKSGVIAILIGALLIIVGFWLLGSQDKEQPTDEQSNEEQPNEEKPPRKVKEKPVYEDAVIIKETNEQPNEE